MIDSHAHLYFEAFEADRDAVISRARAAGVRAVINVGIDLPTSEEAAALALEEPSFFAAAGAHPSSRIADLDQELAGIAALARRHAGKVVAIGEIGLDYHWKEVAPEEQRPRLERQLELALELGLPVIFHCREALEELLELLEGRGARPPGVFHCFAGGPQEARRALALGYHVSFAGNVTYPKAIELQAAARAVPPDRLLLETDSPFLSPQPCRGKRNEPAFARHALEFLARLKEIPVEELERATTESAVRLFRLELGESRPPAATA
jgi:TatD DNase family protein